MFYWHIYFASEGAAEQDASLSPEERRQKALEVNACAQCCCLQIAGVCQTKLFIFGRGSVPALRPPD